MDPLVCDNIVLYSKFLAEERRIFVYLPSGSVGLDEKFPVIYLLDGHSLHNVVSSFVQHYSSRGRIPRMIVASIASTNRVRDFTPTVRGSGSEAPEGGGANNFLNFLTQELIPIIERKYPTNDMRTIIGHSMGGLFTLYTMLSRPDLFRYYLASSPWLLNEDEPLITELERLMKKQLPLSEKLFLAHEHIESNGIEARIHKVVETLKLYPNPNLTWKYKQYEDADHSNLPLKVVPDALDFFYRNK